MRNLPWYFSILTLFLLILSGDVNAAISDVDGFKVTGRVVDQYGKPVPYAEIFLEPNPRYHLGCVIETHATDAQGKFEISESGYSVKKWKIITSNIVPHDIDRAFSLTAGNLGGQEFDVNKYQIDLGDVPLQLHYRVVKFQLPEPARKVLFTATNDDSYKSVHIEFRNKIGDLLQSCGSKHAVNVADQTLTLAVPEGEWQMLFFLGEPEQCYTTAQPLIISADYQQYSLIAKNDLIDSDDEKINALTTEQALARLAKLQIEFSEESYLHRIESRNVTAVKLMLAAHISPNAEYKTGIYEGDSALIRASSLASPEIVKALIDYGVDNSTIDEALFRAIDNYSIEIVEMLIKKGANANCRSNKTDSRSNKGATPLMHAVNSHLEKMGAILLAAGADINAQDINGKTALMYGVERDYPELKWLIDQGADVNLKDINGTTALMHAVKYGFQQDSIKALIKKGARLDEQDANGYTALSYALAENELENAKYLKESGAGPAKLPSKLMQAINDNNIEKVKTALKSKEDLDQKGINGQFPLMQAVEDGRGEFIELLLTNGVNVNQRYSANQTTVLMRAVCLYGGEFVELLLKHQAKVNAQDFHGETALMLAARAGQTSSVEKLLAFGADINLKNFAGKTALELAEQAGQESIVELLTAVKR